MFVQFGLFSIARIAIMELKPQYKGLLNLWFLGILGHFLFSFSFRGGFYGVPHSPYVSPGGHPWGSLCLSRAFWETLPHASPPTAWAAPGQAGFICGLGARRMCGSHGAHNGDIL